MLHRDVATVSDLNALSLAFKKAEILIARKLGVDDGLVCTDVE